MGRDTKDARAIVARRMQAAVAYDREHKQKGKKNGPLGNVGLEVLRELYGMVDYRTGRLDPSLKTICERIRRSKQAVVDAMARLEEHGFLVRVRRAEAIENARHGPQVRQITNAYGFGLPKCLAEKVALKSSSGPLPDCELSRRAFQQDEVEAMLGDADAEQYLRFVVGNDNDELFNGLLRLQASIP